jgi:hypothetical protein
MQVTFVFEKNYFEFRLNRLSERGTFEPLDGGWNDGEGWKIEKAANLKFQTLKLYD